MIERRKLGNTDLDVSKICLGTMTWGYQNSEAQAHEQLDYALAAGVNFVDTAEIYAVPPSAETYGKTETYIGTWLKSRATRDKIILASKVAGSSADHIRGGAGFKSASILQAIEASLKRLQTDYLDLYQLHWPERKVAIWGKLNYDESMLGDYQTEQERMLEILETLNTIQKSGKVRHFGVSNETPWGLMKYLALADKHHLPRMVSIQNAYSMVRREYEVGLAEIAMAEKVGLLAYSPLAGGILTGKYLDGKKPQGARYSTWGGDRMGYYLGQKTEKAIKLYQEIANDLNISLTQLSLAFVNDRSFVSANIIGATSLEQLKENISSASIVLGQELRDRINQAFFEVQNPTAY